MFSNSEIQKFRAKFLKKLLLQKSPETFLEAVRSYLGFVEGAPTSGLYNAPTLMTTRPLNHFFEVNVCHSFFQKIMYKLVLFMADRHERSRFYGSETFFRKSLNFF